MRWDGGTPKTFTEVFGFYHTYVKILYSYVQTQNVLPQETLYELNAAFDHMSRRWTYAESEEEVCLKMYGHLKRSCFDVFKIKVRETREFYDELGRIDTSVIDNGDFDRDLHAIFIKIRQGATEARALEGESNVSGNIPAFDRWQDVFVDCLELEVHFFNHPRLEWAKRRQILGRVRHMFTGLALGIVVYWLSQVWSDDGPPNSLSIIALLMFIASVYWETHDVLRRAFRRSKIYKKLCEAKESREARKKWGSGSD